MPGTLYPHSPDALARISTLFTGAYPVPIRLWAMLDGLIDSRLYTDSTEVPAWALLQELAEGTVYIGGKPSPELLTMAIHDLRQVQDVVICTWPNAGFAVESLPSPDYTGVAVDFIDRSPAVDLSPMTALAAHYELRRIEPALVTLLDGFDYYVAMFGSVEAALQGTVGYCVLQAGEVVAEAVAGPFARGIVELGVGTNPQHRGRGRPRHPSLRSIRHPAAVERRAAQRSLCRPCPAPGLRDQTALPRLCLVATARPQRYMQQMTIAPGSKCANNSRSKYHDSDHRRNRQRGRTAGGPAL